ncbi:porin [Alkalimonas mucilaginosa]|uniref:Porin n=1 Tax=Alkalimonas mucilaginosa TaxID=3057676 RepID=A0ABU7JAT8_9GAMM|nr:porin [Alkalimonas sp. MEB004]MEE2022812.1 porin [Alkalimonas sp. MEB004]
MNHVRAIILTGLCALPFAAMADLHISGFGSIKFGKTFGTVDDPINIGERRDAIFTADFYDVGQYDNDLNFRPESKIAIQGSYSFSPKLSVTAQALAKGVDNFRPEFRWYYLTYRANDNWTFMAGRRNIPMYYYSEFYEVGYAYPWMRPPANLYWWQVTQFDGIHASYNFNWGSLDHTITAFHGNEYSYDNKEMNYYERLYGNPVFQVDEFWTNITGFNWVIEGASFDIRMVYFQNDRDRTRFFNDGTIDKSPSFSQTFMGIGGSYYLNNFTFLFDANYVNYDDPERDTRFPTYLLSVVYRIGDYQPYISYSKADHHRKKATNSKDLEEHQLWSIGVRYDFRPNIAFKIQFDKFDDQGGPGWDYHGSSKLLAAGIDFVF